MNYSIGEIFLPSWTFAQEPRLAIVHVMTDLSRVRGMREWSRLAMKDLIGEIFLFASGNEVKGSVGMPCVPLVPVTTHRLGKLAMKDSIGQRFFRRRGPPYEGAFGTLSALPYRILFQRGWTLSRTQHSHAV